MKLNDAIFGLLLLALGSAVLFAIQGFPKIPGQPVGPALFPGLIATGLCVCGLLLVVRGMREPRRIWLAFDDWVDSPAMSWRWSCCSDRSSSTSWPRTGWASCRRR